MYIEIIVPTTLITTQRGCCDLCCLRGRGSSYSKVSEAKTAEEMLARLKEFRTKTSSPAQAPEIEEELIDYRRNLPMQTIVNAYAQKNGLHLKHETLLNKVIEAFNLPEGGHGVPSRFKDDSPDEILKKLGLSLPFR